MNLPILPDDQSQFNVHSALVDDKVKQLEYHVILKTYDAHELCFISDTLISLISIMLINAIFYLSDSHYSHVHHYCEIVHYFVA